MKLEKLFHVAEQRGLFICTAESCTGGMIAAALTDRAGSSQFFDRGFITYSNASKIEMLGVSSRTIDAFGAVSESVATEMARGALERSDANLAIAVTGIAGPGGSDHKPEGRVCFACARSDATIAKTVEFGPIGRDVVRSKTVSEAINLVIQVVLKN